MYVFSYQISAMNIKYFMIEYKIYNKNFIFKRIFSTESNIFGIYFKYFEWNLKSNLNPNYYTSHANQISLQKQLIYTGYYNYF